MISKTQLSQYIRGTFLKAAITALLAIPAFAIPIPSSLDIDFRSAPWASANGQTSKQVGDVKATAYSNINTTAQLTYESPDGLGVLSATGAAFEEIDGTESLLVQFFNGAGSGINGIWLTDFFNVAGDGTGLGGQEIGSLVYSNGFSTTLNFFASATSGNGEYFIALDPSLNLTSVRFNANPRSTKDDYSVAGFSKAVPDRGTTVALLGLGLIGLAIFRRRTA